MKLRQNNVKIFRKKVEKLQESIPVLYKAVDNWLGVQAERERYGSVNADDAAWARDKIESQLDSFREQLGEIYDFMAEKGLRDIEPTRT